MFLMLVISSVSTARTTSDWSRNASVTSWSSGDESMTTRSYDAAQLGDDP